MSQPATRPPRAGRRERGSPGEHQAVPEPRRRGAAVKKGWPKKTLGEICGFVRGPFGGSLKKSVFVADGFAVYEQQHAIYDQFEDIRYFIDDAKFREMQRFELRPNDLIMSCSGTMGRVAIVPDNIRRGIINQALLKLTPSNAVSPEFLKYWMDSTDFQDSLKEQSGGAAIQNVASVAILKEIQIPLPALPKQQRIVGLLDEAFAGIATAKANAEKNLQNARAIFESHLESVFTQRGKGWVEKKFEELIESNIIGLTKNSREQGEDKDWPYVKMNNITRDNRFDFSCFTCVDATAEEVSKFSLEDGDFLFNTRNSFELVGKSCIYESDSNDAVLFNNNIMRVRFKDGVDARFVLLAFSSKSVADELNTLKSGTTNVSAIYFKDLKSLVIPVPPIAAQKMIAAKLESLSTETQRLARLYERKLAALAALKKSLLHQAFTGEL
jgi:type I restriction enzyme S subunit